jgi:hypothetical protein
MLKITVGLVSDFFRLTIVGVVGELKLGSFENSSSILLKGLSV